MIELKKYKFSDLYEMNSGITSSKEQAGHGAPFVSFSTVFNNYILPDELPDLMDTSEREQKIYSIKKGDILITRTSETLDELAMSSVALKEYPKATYSGFVKRLRPLQTNITYDKFMAFYLRSPYFRKIIQNNTNMTLRASFNEDIFSYLTILLPEYSIQEKIGDFLYTIYEKIQNNTSLIKKLKEEAELLFNYWFLQFDFPNDKGNPYRASGGEMEWNKELKREIPKGWKTTTIGDITICHDAKRVPLSGREREVKKGNIPYYGATGIMDYVDEAIFDGDYVLMAEDGSVMNKKGNPILQRISGKTWVNNHAHILEPSKLHGCKLLMMLLKDVSVMQIKTGSIQMKINQENMNKISVLDIPENLIVAINKCLEPIDQEILHLEREILFYSTLRDFYLPMLMTGEIVF